jgi:hypothetical protein
MGLAASLIISCSALIVSGLTAWWTLFRRGTLKMTQPSVVFFGPDEKGNAKVFFRTLLYSTARRGQVVESMFVKLRREGETQIFSVWVYGETKALVRGSGLFVGYEGMAANHHFLLPKEGPEYKFWTGTYLVEVYAKLVNCEQLVSLWRHELAVGQSEALALIKDEFGLYFDWNPDVKEYAHTLDRNGLNGGKLTRMFEAEQKKARGEELA